ncbi:hypothetical protein PCYB_004020, partial [Plasmodium cynomolgi strain B]
MATIEWDEKLHGFPAYAKYNEFNSKDVMHESNEFCEKKWIQDEKAKKFCRQAVSILRGIHENYNYRNRNDECVYFQHWFSDQVRRYYSNNDKYFSNYDLSNYLFDAINNFNYYNMTDKNYRCYASRNARSVKVEKDLHDYFRNFKNINCKNVSKEKCSMYYDYVKYINDIYKQRIKITCVVTHL